jgi:predicted RNA binding protein YcfA (HicA-like mRNA interferase family)
MQKGNVNMEMSGKELVKLLKKNGWVVSGLRGVII